MKELSDHVRKGGFDYFKVKQTDKGYIFRQEDGTKIVAYEVFKRKENTQFDCISFPGNEAFGSWAWTYRNYDDALNKLQTF